MTLERIKKLNRLEKKTMITAAVDAGIIIGGYAMDCKPLIYVGSALMLYDCYKGITINNARKKLRKKYLEMLTGDKNDTQ